MSANNINICETNEKDGKYSSLKAPLIHCLFANSDKNYNIKKHTK